MEWYLLRTKPSKERWVHDQLAPILPEVFLPMREARMPRWGRMEWTITSLFPGYLFCRFNQHDRLPILKTPGVVQIVGFNRIPAVVDETEISALQTLMATGVANQPCPFLEIGDRVRIESGPLRGLEGILMDFKGHHRLVLSVTLLQRSVAVEIDSALVASVGSAQPSRREKEVAQNRPVQLVV